MKICKTPHNRVVIVTRHDCFEPVPSNAGVSAKYRELVLKPREYDGRMVHAAYDRETDTLYINDR